LLQAIERNAHVDVVRSVLHDVVHHVANFHGKGQMHSG
jgi:hypothetical protein